jgi:hypothetical protein
MLKAQRAWGEIRHDLKLRQEVLRMRARKHVSAAMYLTTERDERLKPMRGFWKSSGPKRA